MTEKKISNEEKKSGFATVGHGLKSYLCDWRNLLGHGLLGVAFLVLAIWAPIEVWIKLLIIAALICFNIWRMRRKSRRAAAKAETVVSGDPQNAAGEPQPATELS